MNYQNTFFFSSQTFRISIIRPATEEKISDNDISDSKLELSDYQILDIKKQLWFSLLPGPWTSRLFHNMVVQITVKFVKILQIGLWCPGNKLEKHKPSSNIDKKNKTVILKNFEYKWIYLHCTIQNIVGLPHNFDTCFREYQILMKSNQNLQNFVKF